MVHAGVDREHDDALRVTFTIPGHDRGTLPARIAHYSSESEETLSALVKFVLEVTQSVIIDTPRILESSLRTLDTTSPSKAHAIAPGSNTSASMKSSHVPLLQGTPLGAVPANNLTPRRGQNVEEPQPAEHPSYPSNLKAGWGKRASRSNIGPIPTMGASPRKSS